MSIVLMRLGGTGETGVIASRAKQSDDSEGWAVSCLAVTGFVALPDLIPLSLLGGAASQRIQAPAFDSPKEWLTSQRPPREAPM